MRLNIDSFKINTQTKDSYYYTSVGEESFLDNDGFPEQKEESSHTYAKKIKNKKSKNLLGKNTFSFYIKAYGYKKLYNPYHQHTIEKINKPTKIENICKNTEYFLEVNEYVFKKYLNFLKTQNKSWLAEAQKDIN